MAAWSGSRVANFFNFSLATVGRVCYMFTLFPNGMRNIPDQTTVTLEPTAGARTAERQQAGHSRPAPARVCRVANPKVFLTR